MTYNAIVIGLGAHGSAAFHHLAKRGLKVLGLDRFPRGRALGSSLGRSRMIRMAYYEHPDYVPLALRAWDLWKELEAESGDQLLHPVGGLYGGIPDFKVFAGARASAERHGLQHEVLDAAEINYRFPALTLREDMLGIWEEKAGWLHPEMCIEAHIRSAERRGAEARFSEPVKSWSASASGVTAVTDAGRYSADTLVITAGCWNPQLLQDLGIPLWVERVPVVWFEPTKEPEKFDGAICPATLIETEFGMFNGFPIDADGLVKLVRNHSGDRCDPDTVDRDIWPHDIERIRAFCRKYMPLADGKVRDASICMFTNTPDEHFVIDTHPVGRVAFASACSGHGFKFASAVGEVLADLIAEGRTRHQIGFLSAARFAEGSLGNRNGYAGVQWNQRPAAPAGRNA
jgi:sarcosine oxidase